MVNAMGIEKYRIIRTINTTTLKDLRKKQNLEKKLISLKLIVKGKMN